MNFLGIKETCLYVDDLEKTKHFYNEILGLAIISYQPGKHIFFRTGYSVLLCFNPHDSKLKASPPGHYGGGKQHFAFEVPNENYDQTKTEIKKKGIVIIDEVTWNPGVQSFYFEDPEGNILEVVPASGIWD
jgi:catechol 2,3-dioxygenase-like lactoylglutathione lyase family enzyme